MNTDKVARAVPMGLPVRLDSNNRTRTPENLMSTIGTFTKQDVDFNGTLRTLSRLVAGLHEPREDRIAAHAGELNRSPFVHTLCTRRLATD
jgi:hypothetical protein